jgi:hypothetical protein
MSREALTSVREIDDMIFKYSNDICRKYTKSIQKICRLDPEEKKTNKFQQTTIDPIQVKHRQIKKNVTLSGTISNGSILYNRSLQRERRDNF